MGRPLHILHWLRYRLSPPGGTTDREQAPARIVFHLSAADTHELRASRSDEAPKAKSEEFAAYVQTRARAAHQQRRAV